MKEIKPKFCKVCKDQFQPYKSTDVVCSFMCSKMWEEQKEIDKRYNKAKDGLEKSDKVKDLMKLSKVLIQKFARVRDKDLPCISCGSNTATVWDGGHLFKSELYSGVRLDEINVNKQCRKCNTFLNGNEVNYVIGFINRYGLPAFNDLSQRAKETKNKKWSVPELQEFINKYKLKIKDL